MVRGHLALRHCRFPRPHGLPHLQVTGIGAQPQRILPVGGTSHDGISDVVNAIAIRPARFMWPLQLAPRSTPEIRRQRYGLCLQLLQPLPANGVGRGDLALLLLAGVACRFGTTERLHRTCTCLTISAGSGPRSIGNHCSRRIGCPSASGRGAFVNFWR